MCGVCATGILSNISTANAQSTAVEMMDLDGDYILSDIIFDTHIDDRTSRQPYRSTLDPISLDQLSQLRSAGIDPSWIMDRFELPGFEPSDIRLTQGDHPLSVEAWANHHTKGSGAYLSDSLSFSVGRTTALRDGNIAGSKGTLNQSTQGDHLPSFAQSEGEYDLFDLSLKWEAIEAGPISLSMISGLKAIEANIGKRITKDGDTSIETVHRFTAIPMIGSSIRWEINRDFSFSSAALTQPIEAGDTLFDFNASTDLRISPNVDFSAGYRVIRSSFEVGSINTEVVQKGFFARLQISF